MYIMISCSDTTLYFTFLNCPRYYRNIILSVQFGSISSDHVLLLYVAVLEAYLSPPGLHHELPGQVGGWLGLEGTNDDALV